eukprot:3212746-Amphidinium_carterae.1
MRRATCAWQIIAIEMPIMLLIAFRLCFSLCGDVVLQGSMQLLAITTSFRLDIIVYPQKQL